MLKLEESQYLNFIFQLNFTKYENKVMIQNCLLHTDLQVWTATFFHKMYIFLHNLKKYYWKSKVQFFNNNIYICMRRIKDRELDLNRTCINNTSLNKLPVWHIDGTTVVKPIWFLYSANLQTLSVKI